MKKAQVSIFIILGIVLLIVILLVIAIIYVSRTNIKTDFESENSENLATYIKQCDQSVVSNYVPRALKTGGYGYYPDTVVRLGTELHVLSYSSEGVAIGIMNRSQTSLFLKAELNDNMIDCINSALDIDNEVSEEQIKLLELQSNVEIGQNSIINTYNYIYKINEQEMRKQVKVSTTTKLGYFLDETNRITQRVLAEQNNNDLFNYQFCDYLNNSKGIRPEYTADFILDVENPNLTFLFEREFFIIFIKQDAETFSFAIMPELQDPYC